LESHASHGTQPLIAGSSLFLTTLSHTSQKLGQNPTKSEGKWEAKCANTTIWDRLYLMLSFLFPSLFLSLFRFSWRAAKIEMRMESNMIPATTSKEMGVEIST
jgi:hypothetical protein